MSEGARLGRRYRRHLYRCGARIERAAVERQDPDHPRGARARGHRGDPPGAGRGGPRARRPVDHHPRHDARDQRDHRAQGREDRACDDRRLSRHDRDPPRKPLRAIRRQYRPAAAPGAAPAALSGARADRRPGPGAGAARRGGGGGARRPARRGRRRSGRDRLSAQLYQPRARAPRRRDPRPRACPMCRSPCRATCRPRCANTSAFRPPAPTPMSSR